MSEMIYRLYFGNNPATPEQMNKVEEIRVEQEIDMTWEARITIAIGTDEQGRWSTKDMDFIKSFSRVRAEIKNMIEPFIPLIDGSVVGYDSQMSSQPGQSLIVLKVRDDSIYLEREETIGEFENMLDHEIAEELFQTYGERIDIGACETTPASGSALTPYVMQRSSAMSLLRQLADRQGFYTYIEPAEKPGRSIAYFRSISLTVSDLPDLILVGKERNVENLDIDLNSTRPVKVTASVLNVSDKSIVTKTSSYENLEVLGKENPLADESEFGSTILRPAAGESADLERIVNAEAARASYAFRANGVVRRKCYNGVLRPYRVVTIRGLNGQLCGNYLIERVSHTITGSYYDQSFAVIRNARSPISETDADNTVGSMIS
jgi:hypothetical protein